MMVTILDGPLGTELDVRGVKSDAQSWSAMANETAPQSVSQIHRQYADQGATVHTANTFRTKLRSVGPRWAELANLAVRLALESVPSSHRVAGSIAPLEDCYDPAISPGAESRAEHRELARVLADAGCDLLLCETFAHADEAMVAVEESVRTGLDTWLALTAGPNSNLMLPAEMAKAAHRAVDSGASAVLVNCTPANETLRFVDAIANAIPGIPVGAYANSGTSGWQSRERRFVDDYLDHSRRWIDAGATLVGGCCGVTPDHIARLRQAFGSSQA